MPKYISVPQGRSCRYDSKTTHFEGETVEGLYSDAFSVCNMVIFYNRELNGDVKISYTHADELISALDLRREKEWVGDSAVALICHKATGRISCEKYIAELAGIQFKAVELSSDDTNFGLAILLDGSLTRFHRYDLPALIVHPREWYYACYYQINTFAAKYFTLNGPWLFPAPDYSTLVNQKIIFDGIAWQAGGEHDVSFIKQAEVIYDDIIRKRITLAKGQTLAVTKNYFLSNERIHPQDILLLGINILCLRAENNYQLLFNEELNNAVQAAKESRMPKSTLAFIQAIRENTKTDFEQFSKYVNGLDTLAPHSFNATLKSTLLGIYKLCLRWRQHSEPPSTLVAASFDAISDGHESQSAMSSSSSSLPFSR